VAIIDGGSFVLPYDHELALGLVRRGHAVDFHGSRTRYNGEFLDDLRRQPGVRVFDRAISGSVAPRWRGALAYAALWLGVWRRRRRYAAINLQFSVLWPLELPFAWLLRRRLVFTVHNAVPHGHRGLRHRPTGWIAALAQRLVFVSSSTRDDFLRRYGAHHAARAVLLPHGLLPPAPGVPCVLYAPRPAPQALVFWGTVKPYKGVELLAELARSPAWQATGMTLEVHGKWDRALHPLRDELIALGVTLRDSYLDATALQTLLAREVLFILPYTQATQSGALYTLLHQGCRFLCADSGDLGDFMRRFGLQGLLLQERSAGAVIECLPQVSAAATLQALQHAQAQMQWDATLADAAQAYGT
jgi:glycosyltransferase involved in cell wall biosynthesis